ncbi:DUF6498-containing protein [Natronococcus sp. A-GB1]|uniref:DUF6498-containing protein n=1 Tax=Natronococcus sp. A-GB1 TaxID=3037648 RepID=UPI00241FADF7|nr:DUF6498-containing protein [Natronococcus sp. A-GB1]MDG5757929.1 DUF6498-containing protein [Natronococcus sp. A-GB1]
MVVRDVTDGVPSAVRFLPILLANLIPLVGVLAYGWEASTVVVIYALEVILALPLAAAKALFAGRPPRIEELEDDESGGDSSVIDVANLDLARKRGSVRLVSWLPPVYPRNLPFVGSIFFVTVWVVLFVVAALAELAVGEALARPEVWLGVTGLVVGQGVETWRDYVRDGRYETTSPYAVVETPARQAFFLLFVLIAVAETTGVIVLGAFVAVKLLVDWSAFRATSGDGGRLSGWFTGPDDDGEVPDPPPVPDGDPDTTFETHAPTVVLTGALHTLVKPAPFYALIVLLAWVVTLGVVGGNDGVGLALTAVSTVGAVLAFVGFLAVKTAEHVLEYGLLEYRRYDDRLVAYDTWVETAQWNVPLAEIRDATLVTDRLPDRVFGTRTFKAQTGWGGSKTRRELGPVRDADAFVGAIDLPVRTTELGPIDRRTGVLVAAAAPVGVVVAVAVGPWPPVLTALYIGFGLAFVVPILCEAWKRAYPDPH